MTVNAARLRLVEVGSGPPLDEYRFVEGQADLVDPLRARGTALAKSLGRRRVWMINSTASGGGVAATIPHLCAVLRQIGVDARWLVLEPADPSFFAKTKRLHHLLHGRGEPAGIDGDLRESLRAVGKAAARSLSEHLERGDVVVVHDPQPCALAAFLPESAEARLIWRCHVGVPFRNAATEAAWSLLHPWLAPYARMVFTSERYAPDDVRDRVVAMTPTIDPFSHKNRPLPPYKLLGILRAGGLLAGAVPAWARFIAPAQRHDGERGRGFASTPIEGLGEAPIFLHVSRFDPLKGFFESLAAFAAFVERGPAYTAELRASSARANDELQRALLVLAGPDPSGVSDDPEAAAVLAELCRTRDALPAPIAARVHIVRLPMVNAKENALLVNALQRIASVIVQPSLEEGFGLTVTEAIYKGVPVVATNVGGIALQIRAGVDGRLIERAGDIPRFAEALIESLVLVKESERMARSAQLRAAQHFLVLREVSQWVELLASLV